MYWLSDIADIIPGSTDWKEQPKDFAINELTRRRYIHAMYWTLRISVFVNNVTQVRVEQIEEPKTLQQLRDEVRQMVASGQPKADIPLYRGQKQNGSPVEFLKKYYSRYLLFGEQHTLFLHDLRVIDTPLARALNTVCNGGGEPMPLGTKPDLTKALISGLFTDGEETEKRVKMAQRRQKKSFF